MIDPDENEDRQQAMERILRGFLLALLALGLLLAGALALVLALKR